MPVQVASAPPRALRRAMVRARHEWWPEIDYRPHSGQVRIHDDDTRNRVASCGRRFGKSTLGGHELVPEAYYAHSIQGMLKEMGKRREFWIVGPEYSDAEKEFRVIYNDLSRLEMPFDRPGTYNNPESGDLHISLWQGTFEIHAKSAKYPQTLVGEGLAGVIMGEAAKLKERVWTKFIRPTLADSRGWSLHTSTPEGKNWFYELWQRGQDPNDGNWASYRMPSWVNDLVFPDGATPEGIEMMMAALYGNESRTHSLALLERCGVDDEIVDMAKDMSEERFKQEIGADFTEFVGRVFKDFDEEVHVRDIKYDPRYPTYAAVDYGWTNPFVCLFIQVDVWDNVYVIGEYRVTRRDINDIARDLNGYPISGQVKTLFPDPAEPGDSAILEKTCRWKINNGTGGELKWRLEMIRQKLKVDTHVGEPKLFIDRSCRELIREMQDYRYPDTKEEQNKENPEKPMDKDDHGPEAMGRFFRGYYGGPAEAGRNGKARVKKVSLG